MFAKVTWAAGVFSGLGGITRRPTRIAAGAFALAASLAVYAIWQLTHFGPSDQQALMSNLFFLPVDAAAFAMAGRASRRTTASPRVCRAWRLLALAAAAQFLGDLTYTCFELGGAAPFPSLADGFSTMSRILTRLSSTGSAAAQP